MAHCDLTYQVALSMLSGIGGKLGRQLISTFGSPKKVLEASSQELIKTSCIGPKLSQSIIQERYDVLRRAEKEVQACTEKNISILFYTDKDYPSRLRRLADAPILLYQRGETDLNVHKVISIVGTRAADQYGARIIQEFLEELRQLEKLIVVSGMAYGIDIMAHREAIKQNIPTVGVMANGLDIIYPSVHKNTAIQMVNTSGCLLSENPLGTTPDASKFPARNRIIAGMSDIVLVVQAKNKGGALITASFANQYNVEVAAVPGNIHADNSQGCHQLIQQHQAHLITSAQELCTLMNWQEGPPQAIQKKLFIELSPEEALIHQHLSQKSMHMDELLSCTELTPGQLSNALLQLEFNGILQTLPGKRYILK
ncbi:DNA-processing protein DprA [Algivirga pacifica]|uniref:DNA-processing protein DprA n=1 Tax=Algivirga pacifica TaxID=1162670 RepID=A0ABP9DCY1_9BACT